MRNKIKQLLKKEGGFTLVELLGVIVILGLIIGISIPLIGNVVDKAKTDTDKAEAELVFDAAKMYYLQETDAVDPVTTVILIDKEYLEAGYKGTVTSVTKAEVKAGKLATTTQ
ncbi:prepilin-type N-terminal cleavage/methylation domain-containing protein [Trichococcus sp. K1Tr]|uniref:prepilin-type N-terminal cleavage/methylation domain-containing protein n=1 Tax=Trichococcus sp. K1Tr TaxID=3020847 RepID=UPI00232FADC5|nr:prepilin-type N-terminal cleavage/methylation domain-containing protein [Trichococcus sp. K1Tr]MDB6354160.1 prepilin-type N-terminal cleavage/methylation domain-containing protein [Trichococcus sp. K1Tr]